MALTKEQLKKSLNSALPVKFRGRASIQIKASILSLVAARKAGK